MTRFLAGVFSALLLAAAGVFWWQGRAENRPAIPDAPMARSGGQPLLGAAMPDPPQASAATREEKRFNRYDKDRDDLITSEEYLASRRKAFARLDVNGDGRLSFDEWSVKTREKFSRADADRSKTLTRKEFATTAVKRKAKARPDCPPARAGDEEEG